MKILKFGGSSVRDAERIAHVARIVQAEAEKEPIGVVLSAMKGVTDQLIRAGRVAERGESGYREILEDIEKRHLLAVGTLFEGEAAASVSETVRRHVQELTDILRGVELVRECSLRTLDLLMSFGERLSCMLFARYLPEIGVEAEYLDARELIITDSSHGRGNVDFPESYRLTAIRFASLKGLPVVTGFIASDRKGVTTTLGRNGSDYTASIIAAGCGAGAVEIWTDVDGVLSADPRYVGDAFVLSEISVQEAMELSYFGAEVIHPYTMLPAVEKNIPLLIRNTMNPAAPGTRITRNAPERDADITGIASIENVALINVEGGGMVGIPGIASRIFAALADAGANIIMISQASSEHSVCVVLREQESEAALQYLERELEPELRSKKIQQFELIRDLEIVAIIGDNMRGRPGISGRLFSALGEDGINVLAIAQGSSERNISFVVEGKDREKALNTVHRAFLGGKR